MTRGHQPVGRMHALTPGQIGYFRVGGRKLPNLIKKMSQNDAKRTRWLITELGGLFGKYNLNAEVIIYESDLGNDNTKKGDE